QFIGRLVEYDPTTGISSSFSCGFVCMCETTYSSGFVAPSSFAGFPRDTANLQAFENDYDCNGNPVTYNVTSLAIFTSGNSSIASVSGSTATLGSSGGATSINASWDTTVVIGAMTCDQELNVNGCPGCNSQAFLGSGSMAATTSLPKFNVVYRDYIPSDHINGPNPCPFVVDTFGNTYIPLIYKGDGSRNTYRATESLVIVPDAQQSSGFLPDTGFTRNYGPPSPVRGLTLSVADDDNVPKDCHLWNDQGKADPGGFSVAVSYSTAHQGQVHFSGSAPNPLEPQLFQSIAWDMSITIDTSNPHSPTATVSYNHTCYPAHQVKVNGTPVYSYNPPSDTVDFQTKCLLLHLGTVSGQTPLVPVPAQ
ncbi:MAG: hypothetical protein ACHQWV_01235, partial [Nitrospirales bacterium]